MSQTDLMAAYQPANHPYIIWSMAYDFELCSLLWKRGHFFYNQSIS